MTRKASTTARGYGWQHQQLRNKYRHLVASGRAICWRCGNPIPPGAPWDLGHDDNDRTRYRGPEHQSCNRGAPNRRRRKPDTPATDQTRTW